MSIGRLSSANFPPELPSLPEPPAETFGRRVARAPGPGLEVPSLELGALDVQVDAKPRAEGAGGLLGLLGLGPEPVVDVQGSHRLRSAQLDESNRQAGGVGTA